MPGRSERDLLTRFGGGGGAGSSTQEEPEQEGNGGAVRRWGTKLDGSSRQPPREAGVRGTLLSGNKFKSLPACFSIAPTALTIHPFKKGAHGGRNCDLSMKKCHFASEQTAFLCLGSLCVAWI